MHNSSGPAGLYQMFDVHRKYDAEKKHTDCFYFVIDVFHDRLGREVLKVYAEQVKAEQPKLSADLLALLAEIDGSE